MNYKILMVDDDRELLKMLNQYFTLKNYTVMIAENGIEALDLAGTIKNAPDSKSLSRS